MKKRKKGSIVNFSSTYELIHQNIIFTENPKINSPIAYATTKSAIINFSKYLATYYGKENIRVNIISLVE